MFAILRLREYDVFFLFIDFLLAVSYICFSPEASLFSPLQAAQVDSSRHNSKENDHEKNIAAQAQPRRATARHRHGGERYRRLCGRYGTDDPALEQAAGDRHARGGGG